MSSKIATWMPLYIGDYLRDTMHLTTKQHGAYLLLIFAYWTKGPLIDDDECLAAITKLDPYEWKEMRPIIECFFSIEESLWTHKRIEEELSNASSRVSARSKAGKAGMAARWHNKGNNKPITNELQNDIPSPSPSPSQERESTRALSSEGVKIPSWQEWWGVCQMVGIPEWRALDEFRRQEAKDDPWNGARGNLRHHAARVRDWWERDGRHLTPPKAKVNGEHQPKSIEEQIRESLQ